MPTFRKELTDLIRPHLAGGKFPDALVRAIDEVLDRAGLPRDGEAGQPVKPPQPATPAKPTPAEAVEKAPKTDIPEGRLTLPGLRKFLGLAPEGGMDEAARTALLDRLANPGAPRLSDDDISAAAAKLGVSDKKIRAVREVETKRDLFDSLGRPSILYERHVFARNTKPEGRFNASHPALSAKTGYGPGGYGKYSAQYDKLASACALDPDAAFQACSWGAFQVLGENAVPIGYVSPLAMALALTTGEAAHLEAFIRFVQTNKLVEKLRACRAGDPASCVPFVRGYNGKDYATYKYHIKLADALK